MHTSRAAWLGFLLVVIHSDFKALFPLHPLSGIGIRQHVGAGMEAAAALVGSEGSPSSAPWLRWLEVSIGFCSSHNGISTKDMPVVVVSEHMLVLVSSHLGCSSPNTNVQLSTATLCAIDF